MKEALPKSADQIIIQVLVWLEPGRYIMDSPGIHQIDGIKGLPAGEVVVEVAVRAEIDPDERDGPLDDARGIQDDTVAGKPLDHLTVPPFFQHLVRQEIHETLEDTAGWSPFRLVNPDDARSLHPVTSLEIPAPELHPSQDVHEGDGVELPVPDRVVCFLAVALADLGRNTPGFQILQKDGMGQVHHPHVADARVSRHL